MIKNIKLFVLIILLITLLFSISTGCRKEAAPPQAEPPKDKHEERNPEKALTSVKADKAPAIDGDMDDMWEKAKAISFELSNAAKLQGSGGDFIEGNTSGEIKTMYDNENIYFLIQWKDEDESIARGPWVKEGEQLVLKPNSTHYEDKFAIFWNINDSVDKFVENGCMVTCHITEKEDPATGGKVKKHWTNGENELLDMWHWKLTRQNTLFGPDKPGLMHDQYVDNVKYDTNDPKTESAGRHSDPGEKEYRVNKKEGTDEPELVAVENLNGNPYVLVEGLDKTQAFTKDYVVKLKEGDFIPGAIAKQITGDPADIKAKGKYKDGQWTLEVQRKLKTDSKFDIQFEDLNKEYYFAVSAFDNSQIGHAYNSEAYGLNFSK